jgi:hypothetical protein
MHGNHRIHAPKMIMRKIKRDVHAVIINVGAMQSVLSEDF